MSVSGKDDAEVQNHVRFLNKLFFKQRSTGQSLFHLPEITEGSPCECLQHFKSLCCSDSTVDFDYVAEGCDATVLKMTIDSNVYAVKCFEDRAAFKHEVNANQVLKRYLPNSFVDQHLICGITHWTCSGFRPSRKRKGLHGSTNGQPQRQHVLPFLSDCIMISEFAPLGTLDHFMKCYKLSMTAWRSLLLQAAYTFYALQSEGKTRSQGKLGLIHKDAHDGNWGLLPFRKESEDDSHISIKDGFQCYHVPELNCTFRIPTLENCLDDDAKRLQFANQKPNTRQMERNRDDYLKRLKKLPLAPRLALFDFGYMCSTNPKITRYLPARRVQSQQKESGMHAGLKQPCYDIVFFAATLFGQQHIKRYMPRAVQKFLLHEWMGGQKVIARRGSHRPRDEDYEHLNHITPLSILKSDFFKPLYVATAN